MGAAGRRLMANLGGAEQDDEGAAERVQASFMALAEACDFQVHNPTRHPFDRVWIASPPYPS